MPPSVSGYIVTDCPCIVSSLDLYFYLCFSVCVSVSAYITANFACTLLYPYFSLIFCLWMCIPVSEYIIIQSWCISMSFDPCFSHSFSMIVYVCIRLYFKVTDSTYIGTSLIPRFCRFSLYLSFSVPWYSIGNMHVCEQARSARSVCNNALENVCLYYYYY